jgi:hypothetical protein
MARLVKSELSGDMIPIDSEEWWHECEVAFLLGLPEALRTEMLDGVPGSTARDNLGIIGARGAAAVAELRADIHRLARIRATGRKDS